MQRACWRLKNAGGLLHEDGQGSLLVALAVVAILQAHQTPQTRFAAPSEDSIRRPDLQRTRPTVQARPKQCPASCYGLAESRGSRKPGDQQATPSQLRLWPGPHVLPSLGREPTASSEPLREPLGPAGL